MKSKAVFETGFIDGFIERALAYSLEKARGQFLSDSEKREALATLRDLPMSTVARRILDARGMTTGAARFNAILGK